VQASCVAAIGVRLKASLRSLNLSLAASEPLTNERQNDRSALVRPPSDKQTPDVRRGGNGCERNSVSLTANPRPWSATLSSLQCHRHPTQSRGQYHSSSPSRTLREPTHLFAFGPEYPSTAVTALSRTLARQRTQPPLSLNPDHLDRNLRSPLNQPVTRTLPPFFFQRRARRVFAAPFSSSLPRIVPAGSRCHPWLRCAALKCPPPYAAVCSRMGTAARNPPPR
jgi:hypothetical protein